MAWRVAFVVDDLGCRRGSSARGSRGLRTGCRSLWQPNSSQSSHERQSSQNTSATCTLAACTAVALETLFWATRGHDTSMVDLCLLFS